MVGALILPLIGSARVIKPGVTRRRSLGPALHTEPRVPRETEHLALGGFPHTDYLLFIPGPLSETVADEAGEVAPLTHHILFDFPCFKE